MYFAAMVDRKKIAVKLRVQRELLGLQNKEIAARINMDPTSVSNHMTGRTQCELETLQKYSKLFNVPLEYFLDDEWPAFEQIQKPRREKRQQADDEEAEIWLKRFIDLIKTMSPEAREIAFKVLEALSKKN